MDTNILQHYQVLESYILSLPGTVLSHPFGPELSAYFIGESMFALLRTDKQPLQLSLRCDPRLSSLLRERYDEVMPGQRLSKKNWNTIVLSGQLSEEEVKDLIRHAHSLVSGPINSSEN